MASLFSGRMISPHPHIPCPCPCICTCTCPCPSTIHVVASRKEQKTRLSSTSNNSSATVTAAAAAAGDRDIQQLHGHVKKKQQQKQHRYVPPRGPLQHQHQQESSRKRHHHHRQQGTGGNASIDGGSAAGGSYALAQKTAMMKIIEKLQNIQKIYNDPSSREANLQIQTEEERPGKASLPGELFLPKPDKDLFSIGRFWTSPDHPVPAPGRSIPNTKFPWEFDNRSDQDEKEDQNMRVKAPTVAELMIPPAELRRLRTLSISLPNSVKIGKLGVTINVADNIMQRWQNDELVKVKCEGPAAENMFKIHRDLERKTGGLVVWRSGSVVVVYRGSDFDIVNNIPTGLEKKLEGLITHGSGNVNVKSTLGFNDAALHETSEIVSHQNLDKFSEVMEDATVMPSTEAKTPVNQIDDAGSLHKLDGMATDPPLDLIDMPDQSKDGGTNEGNVLSMSQSLRKLNAQPDPFIDREYEIEIEGILDSLGSRYKEWKGLQPAPVDADLLLSEIPNYRSPYRLLPYGVEPKLTNSEQTNLRRLARHIGPHFALGRNRGLQGLAAAILKLWERSEVAKIVIKAGVQNMRNEIMAEELKKLTGGVLLGRDKYFITLYRGKDFLPRQVAFALTERMTMLRTETVVEDLITINPNKAINVGKLCGQSDASTGESKKSDHFMLAQNLERKLAMAIGKKEAAQQDLKELENILMPVDEPAEVEVITEEERFMFRKLGLKMSAFLLVGKRGIFDGVIENMHLHWKHRELVKVIVKERDLEELQRTAKMLEYASGGVLVAVVVTSKGHAIIMYRGKNYERPASLRPDNLLTKKEALKRSVEMQRCASLSRHIKALEEEICKLKTTLKEAGESKDEFLSLSSEDENSSANLQDGLVEDVQRVSTNRKKSCAFEMDKKSLYLDKKNVLKLVQSGPIFKADQLTNVEKIKLRKKAFKLHVGSRFSVGKSNSLAGLARHIRIHFLRHSLVVIGIKNRGRGTSKQELVGELEELTGGVLVSYEASKIIMYRGWPSGEKIPFVGSSEEVTPELRAALEAEDAGWDLVDENSCYESDIDSSEANDGDLILSEAEHDEEEYYFSQLIDSHGKLFHEGHQGGRV